MPWIYTVVCYFALCAALSLWLKRREAREQAHLPDCPVTFTKKQIKRFVDLRAQYGAKLDDLPDSDDNYTQMNVS